MFWPLTVAFLFYFTGTDNWTEKQVGTQSLDPTSSRKENKQANKKQTNKNQTRICFRLSRSQGRSMWAFLTYCGDLSSVYKELRRQYGCLELKWQWWNRFHLRSQFWTIKSGFLEIYVAKDSDTTPESKSQECYDQLVMWVRLCMGTGGMQVRY